MSINGEFSRSTRDEHKKIEVCCGGMCASRGSDKIFEKLQQDFKDTDTVIQMCNCLGRCRQGPNVLVDEKRIIHYNKPRTVTQRILDGEGHDFVKYDEENIDLEGDYLGDL